MPSTPSLMNITAGTLIVPSSVNYFDPSQNPNPLTDTIKSTRRTRNPKIVPIGLKGAPGEIREI